MFSVKLLTVLLVAICVVSCVSGLVERKEVRKMSTKEWDNYSNAIKKLRATPSTFNPNASRYDDFVRIHVENYDVIHGCSPLLPWHRWFVRTFELALQQVSKNSSISVPYWDWTLDYKGINASAVMTSKYLGSPTGTATKHCIRNGLCANWLTFYDGIDETDPPGQCLTREYNPFWMTSMPSPALMHKMLNSSPDYNSLRSTIEAGPHNNFHHGIGGDMAGTASPNDAIFWSHHSFIDKIWADWQNINVTEGAIYEGPLCNTTCGNRLGCRHQPASVNDILVGTPNVTVAQVMNITAYGYKYTTSAGTSPLVAALEFTESPSQLPLNPPMTEDRAMGLDIDQANAAINNINTLISSINVQNGF
ncbi:hypothetical protein SAMD00019534_071230 [Acytostelium subglobosum LB1]|uniref:hypothetical protein n=1 Tax=Acytostelium subglobosum LB1 TaxID=1410327 RepID=UPI00064513D9|nr:hypothetical protein SAMD00019534_071230 [Acytostelium subglobosum LB1]GAM23948.1 hypothetical protein SAMD00019534_071230 [Acytostelium subglobosum LB1]|eukprot:XP_012752984.1 hypothetical protein SAMD00019534_071230 [Acytostelium subglobosum LB1]